MNLVDETNSMNFNEFIVVNIVLRIIEHFTKRLRNVHLEKRTAKNQGITVLVG